MTSDKVTILPDGRIKTKDGLTRTTVGIYLRPLRAVFNTAIELKEIDRSIYPFGKRGYTIPKGQKVKKALSKAQLALLRDAAEENTEQKKAKDFWFFSYTCQGMNVKDICLLRNEDLSPESLSFFRAKTKNTNKNQYPVTVMLTNKAKEVIAEYRNPDTSPKAFVFPILKTTDTNLEKRRKIQNFTKFINQHIKKLASKVGITEDISTYFARHSFATLAIQGGAGMEFVMEALSHSDIKTTQGYFAGFEDAGNKKILDDLMNF
jgi:integrase